MKAKSLLALLAAAAMLCTAALPAYAEEPLPDAPAVVEAQAEETAPANDTQPETDTPEQQEVTTLETPENEGETGIPETQEGYTFSIGNYGCDLSKGDVKYLKMQGDDLVESAQDEANVIIEAQGSGHHVTLKNLTLTKPENSQALTAVFTCMDLHLTLVGKNSMPDMVQTTGILTIDGEGELDITVANNSSVSGISASDATIGDKAKVSIHINSTGGFKFGMNLSSGKLRVNNNAEVSVEGNAAIGVSCEELQVNGGTLSVSGTTVWDNYQGGVGINAYTAVTVNGGTLTVKDVKGNGIMANKMDVKNASNVTIDGMHQYNNGNRNDAGVGIFTQGNVSVENSQVTASNTEAGGIFARGEIDFTGGTITCDGNKNTNDIMAAGDLKISGGNIKVTNGGVALTAWKAIKIENADINIDNISGHGLSAGAVDGNAIEIKDTTLTIKNGGFDGAVTTSGNISVTGGKFTIDGAKRFGLHAGSGQNATNSDVIIDGAEVKINSVSPMLASPVGDVKISGKSKITGASSDGNALYSNNNIQITGNDCEIEVTGGVKGIRANKEILFENADELVKYGGTDAASAQQIEAAELPNYQYIHIFKGKTRPKEDVVIDTKNWTEGDSAKVPTITDKDGNELKAKVYYKVKGADDSTYTETVPTAAGDYETKLVVLADGEYGEAVYYSAFTIVAKSTPSNGDNSGNSNSGNTGSSTTTTTTVTATAPTPTSAPRAEAKAQSAPAAVTATIPQTSDTFPYAILATLMGTAALGMAGITILRKKRQ